jgi:hypothetical protein
MVPLAFDLIGNAYFVADHAVALWRASRFLLYHVGLCTSGDEADDEQYAH